MVAMSRALLRACARAPSIAPGRLAAIRHASSFLTDYNKHVEERSAMGIETQARPLSVPSLPPCAWHQHGAERPGKDKS